MHAGKLECVTVAKLVDPGSWLVSSWIAGCCSFLMLQSISPNPASTFSRPSAVVGKEITLQNNGQVFTRNPGKTGLRCNKCNINRPEAEEVEVTAVWA